MEARRFYVITGGTMVHVAPHFSLCAPAYGRVGEHIAHELRRLEEWWRAGQRPEIVLVRTRMALGSDSITVEERRALDGAGINFLETNEDLEKLIDHLVLQPETKGIVMAAAVCDWVPEDLGVVDRQGALQATNVNLVSSTREFGKKMPRLGTRPRENWDRRNVDLQLRPADKILGKIRKVRKDIFLVGFKATTGMAEQEQYLTGLGLLKGASCNLVLANDVHEHRNMVITPEEAKYHVGKDRKAAIRGLCEMIVQRSRLHFTRSTVVEGEPIPWDSDEVPDNLRKVVNHCIERGAYKPFQGKTVGHFATRGPRKGIIYTSRRKSNFNELAEDGLLRIDTVGDDQVIAYGAKPSVGGQSQRIIFDEHPDVDCIVHFHCPLRTIPRSMQRMAPGADPEDFAGRVPVRPQRPYECGSHECGRNTSDGLAIVDEDFAIKAVMLDEHGPNICFPRDTDPDAVIEFIEEHFDLEGKTGGPVSLEGGP